MLYNRMLTYIKIYFSFNKEHLVPVKLYPLIIRLNILRCRTAVYPLLVHWRYHRLSLSHQDDFIQHWTVDICDTFSIPSLTAGWLTLEIILLWAGNHFTKGLWARNWNLVKLFFVLILIMIQSCHNFAHVMTAELSWHVQNCDVIWSLYSKS